MEKSISIHLLLIQLFAKCSFRLALENLSSLQKNNPVMMEVNSERKPDHIHIHITVQVVFKFFFMFCFCVFVA